MVDVLTPEQRRRCMSRIKGSDTKPELALRRALWASGLRYRLKTKLPGKPDIVFPSAKVAVFVDGCFWHGCHEHSVKPKTNADFWSSKLATNKERDVRVNTELKTLGWVVLRFWEHEIKNDLDSVAERISECLHQKSN